MRMRNPTMTLCQHLLGKILHSTTSTLVPSFSCFRLAEIVEVETENYLKMDPDPFDERHPSRTDPSGTLGHVLKALFRKDNLTNKVTK